MSRFRTRLASAQICIKSWFRSVRLFLIIPFIIPLNAQAEPADDLRLWLNKAQNRETLDLQDLSDLAMTLEVILRDLRANTRILEVERAGQADAFYTESRDYARLLAVLSSLRSAQMKEDFLHPKGTKGAIQAEAIMAALTTSLEKKLGVHGQDLATLETLSKEEEALYATLEAALQEMESLKAQIIAQDSGTRAHARADDPMMIDRLLSFSDNLDEFVDRLGGLASASPEGEQPPSTDAGWVWPVSGQISKTERGVEIETTDMLVHTPVTATVRFAASYLDYGQTVILEPAKGWFLVISGFDQFAAKEGQILKPGDIIGFNAMNLPGNAPDDNSSLENMSTKLYLELNSPNGQVDPRDYFTNKP